MSDARPRIRIAEQQLIELAGLLSRGEVIPESLGLLLEEVGRDPEKLARLEEHRSWWSLLGEATESDRGEPEAMLVLLVHPTASPQPRFEILASQGWTMPVDLSMKREGAKLVLQLPEMGARVGGVPLEITTPEGDFRSSTVTDERGTARIPIEGPGPLRLVLRWPPSSI